MDMNDMGKKRLFSKISNEEAEVIRREQQVDSFQSAIKMQQGEKKLFTYVEKKSENQENENMAPISPPHYSKISENNIIEEEISENVEVLPVQNYNLAINARAPRADEQDYLGAYIPQTSLVPNRMQAMCEAKSRRKEQEIDIDHAQFLYSNGGLYAVDGEQMQYVGNFSCEILEKKEKIQEIVNEASEVVHLESQVMWQVKIIVLNREYLGYIENEKLLELSWVSRISQHGAELSSKPNAKKLLKKYLQNLVLEERYYIVKEFASCGWKWFANGTVCYLTADGAIGFEGGSVKASDKFKLYTKPIERQKIFQDFLDMRAIIPGNLKNAVFLQYNLMAALLTALFKKAGFQIEFCTALIGKTNTKKTSCGEIFTRVFNRTNSAVPEINFSATEAAIYEIMDHYADAIVMIDDLTPSENDMDAREKRRKLENIIRAYGDRVPRRRSTAFAVNSNVKEFTPIRGCALITGETFTGGKSSRSRVVVLNFEEGDVNDSVLSHFQSNLHTLPNFVEDFLCYVTGRVERVMEVIVYECQKARVEMKNIIKLPRYIDAYGVLCAATSIFGRYIAESGWMNQEMQRIMENDRQLLLQVILENDAQVSNIAPGITILEALKHALEKHDICMKDFCDIGDEKPENYVIYDDDFYYITSDRLWECAKKYADYRKIYFPYKNGRELIEPLKMENFLYIKREGGTNRASHKITVNGKVVNKRFLLISKEKADKIWADLENF